MKTLSFFLIICALCALPVPAQTNEAQSTRILVAYHSETGNTEALARAIVEGMKSVAGVEPTLRRISDVTDEEIQQADGLLVGTPVYWASLHARVKDFVDRVGSVLGGETHGEGRTAGAFCTGGSPSAGKELARLSILSAFMNMRFVIIGGVAVDGFGTLGADATTPPDNPGLSEQELEAARRTGKRFARITAQLGRARSK